MTQTRDLATFVSDLRFADLPRPVVEKAAELALHSFGVQLAASTLPWSKSVYRAARDEGGAPQSTVVTYGLRTSAATAAYVNGAFAHGFELDDNLLRTGLKGGSVTVPTALAVGEHQCSSGRDFIVAMVAGYELMARVGNAIGPGSRPRKNHMSGTVGALGAAAVTSRLRELDVTTTAHAIGLASSAGVGFSESPPSGRGHAKRVFPALAAGTGVRCAALAAEGLTGSGLTLDPGTGLMRAYGIEGDAAETLASNLGTRWEILDLSYKIYAQDGFIQPMSEAIEKIRAAHPFATDDVEQVVVGTSVAAKDMVGRIREPKDLTDAQFSGTFSLALLLQSGGASFRDYTAESLRDPRVLALSERVVLEVDDEMDREYVKSRPRGAKVRIRLRSGQEFAERIDNMRDLTPPTSRTSSGSSRRSSSTNRVPSGSWQPCAGSTRCATSPPSPSCSCPDASWSNNGGRDWPSDHSRPGALSRCGRCQHQTRRRSDSGRSRPR